MNLFRLGTYTGLPTSMMKPHNQARAVMSSVCCFINKLGIIFKHGYIRQIERMSPFQDTTCDVNHTGPVYETGYCIQFRDKMARVNRIWYLSPMRAAKVQASLRIRAVSPEPLLVAYISSEPRGTFRQKARSLAPLNDWACAVKICHDGMLEGTNSLDAAQMSPSDFGDSLPNGPLEDKTKFTSVLDCCA